MKKITIAAVASFVFLAACSAPQTAEEQFLQQIHESEAHPAERMSVPYDLTTDQELISFATTVCANLRNGMTTGQGLFDELRSSADQVNSGDPSPALSTMSLLSPQGMRMSFYVAFAQAAVHAYCPEKFKSIGFLN